LYERNLQVGESALSTQKEGVRLVFSEKSLQNGSICAGGNACLDAGGGEFLFIVRWKVATYTTVLYHALDRIVLIHITREELR